MAVGLPGGGGERSDTAGNDERMKHQEAVLAGATRLGCTR